MSKSEICAKRDGIEFKDFYSPIRGNYRRYYIPCEKCGDIIERAIYASDKNYLCEYCKLNLKRKKKIIEQSNLDKIRTKKEQAFDKAVLKIK